MFCLFNGNAITDLSVYQQAIILSGIQIIRVYHLFQITVVDSQIFCILEHWVVYNDNLNSGNKENIKGIQCRKENKVINTVDSQ